MKPKVTCFIPIRLNSKRVRNKNLRKLNGKPLISHIVETVSKVESIDETYIYSSADSLKKFCINNVRFLERSPQLDRDDTLGIEIYESFVKEIDSDIYVLVHATSPFTKVSSLKKGIQKLINNENDSAFTVLHHKTFSWFDGKPLNYSLENVIRTQEIKPVYTETSGFYIFKKELIIEHKRRIGFNPYLHIVDHIEGIDIDYPQDFEFAESVSNIARTL